MSAELNDRNVNAAADEMRERLRSCEDEPIRIPGSIQQHGFLLLLSETDGHIVAASQNAEEYLGLPLHLLLGAPLENVLDREILRALHQSQTTTEAPEAQSYLGAFPVRGKLYSVVAHCVGPEGHRERMVEFESMDRLVSPEMANQVFTNFVSKLSVLGTEQELCDALAEQIKLLTGFNRVMLYRFDEEGHGTVLSEQNDGTLPSYLDLRFPASDIPKQARELYVLNTVRIIPDAGYTPSPLRAAGGRPIATLDLSMSTLRSVSPIHIEYMRNMGTLSSMSVSMVCDGKLWGLVSGHHATPHLVPYIVRSACDLLTKLVCTQLMNLWASANLKQTVHFHAVQRSLLTQMASENNYLGAIGNHLEETAQVVDAAGAALVTGGEIQSWGLVPPTPVVEALADWLYSQPEVDLFETRSLSADVPGAADAYGEASGLLAIRISQVSRSYVLWFRPEVVSTVRWAGPPRSGASSEELLNPRTSFEQWKESLRGRSVPWTQIEIDSAEDFRAAVTTVGLKRAEEAVKLGEARFLQLTHTLPNLIFTADDKGCLSYVNERWLEQGLSETGYWYDQPVIIPEDAQRCAAVWPEAAAKGGLFETELRLLSAAENNERWYLVRVAPYSQIDQRPAGWVGIFTDLTDRRQREAALRMSEKLALTGRMTSVIAHEINNPLESLTNLLFLLRDHVTEDDSARTYIGMAESELQRISGITKQTLRWSREGAGSPATSTAGEIFSDVLQLLSARIRNRGVVVTVESGRGVKVYGTISQLTQVVVNLVSNAVQAVPVGGSIWLSASADAEATRIVVRDAGHGMSEETQRNLFQPFFSTKGDLGNGLGLYISKEIVERHGGRLVVQSQGGIGTRMEIVLPAVSKA